MAEWLCCGLQIRRPRFDSGSRLHNFCLVANNYVKQLRQHFCPSGGIGRHKGFKIPRLIGVPVQVWPRVPLFFYEELTYDLLY